MQSNPNMIRMGEKKKQTQTWRRKEEKVNTLRHSINWLEIDHGCSVTNEKQSKSKQVNRICAWPFIVLVKCFTGEGVHSLLALCLWGCKLCLCWTEVMRRKGKEVHVQSQAFPQSPNTHKHTHTQVYLLAGTGQCAWLAFIRTVIRTSKHPQDSTANTQPFTRTHTTKLIYKTIGGTWV